MANRGHVPTKIAIVHGQLNHGGSERQLYLLLKHCDRLQWSPRLFISGELGVWETPIRKLDIPITLLQGNPLQKMWQFRQLCVAQEIRHFLSWGSYTNGYGLALTGLGASRIGSFRNANFADLPEQNRWFWSWMSMAGVSSIICNSTETLHALRDAVEGRKHIVYMPNSVQSIDDPGHQRRDWRQRLGVHDQELLVVGVGRLTEQKNFDRFIDAIVVTNRATPVRAVIAGPDMGMGSCLQSRIEASGLEPGMIQLIGAVPDARELICAADIFMLSSDYEGMPNVVLEAMAAGIPCVCTRVNGISELIDDGIHGFVTDHHERSLAEAVLRLVRDPDLRRDMGRRASARVQEAYNPAAISKRLWQIVADANANGSAVQSADSGHCRHHRRDDMMVRQEDSLG